MANEGYERWEDRYLNYGGFSLLSNRQQANVLGVSEASVRRYRAKFDAQTDAFLEAVGVTDGVTRAEGALSSFQSALPKPLEVVGAAMITGDIHVPLTDLYMVSKMFEISSQHGIRTCVVAGDLNNYDSLGRFDVKQQDHTLKQEIDITREFVGGLLDFYQDVVIIKGNHEDRFLRALGYKMGYVDAMQTLLGSVWEENEDRLFISPLDHLYCFGPNGEKWYVCHPKAYSRQPLATPRALAAKHHCHVICGHAHHHAIGSDISGQYVCAELGGLFDPDKQQYLREATTFPKQQNGLMWLSEQGKLHSWSRLWES